MIKRKMADCVKVFLDTSILIDLLNKNSKDERALFVKILIDSLNENKPAGKKDRTFFISTITIGEMVKFSSKKSKEVITDLLAALNCKNLEVVEYSDEIALNQNTLFKDYLSKTNLNKLLDVLKAFPENYLNGREYISRDFMIISTAHYINSDVIITCDKKTFKPIADLINIPCYTAYKENFHLSKDEKKVYEFL